MPDQTKQNSYNCVLIFKEMTNKTNFQLLAFSYAQLLKQLGAKNIINRRIENSFAFIISIVFAVSKSNKTYFLIAYVILS